jgi:hypothetical protein
VDLVAAVAGIGEVAKLVDGEKVTHLIAELLGHVPGVLPERLGRLA